MHCIGFLKSSCLSNESLLDWQYNAPALRTAVLWGVTDVMHSDRPRQFGDLGIRLDDPRFIVFRLFIAAKNFWAVILNHHDLI